MKYKTIIAGRDFAVSINIKNGERIKPKDAAIVQEIASPSPPWNITLRPVLSK